MTDKGSGGALFVAAELVSAKPVLASLVASGRPITRVKSIDDALLSLAERAFVAVFVNRFQGTQNWLEVLSEARRRIPTIPVLAIGPFRSASERIAALEVGADDCVSLPMDPEELCARINALVRRIVAGGTGGNEVDQGLRVGPLQLLPVAGVALHSGRPLQLSPTEFRLLQCLVAHIPDHVGSTVVLRDVFGLDGDPGTNIVAVYVHRLRRKLIANRTPLYVQAVRGSGYRLKQLANVADEVVPRQS